MRANAVAAKASFGAVDVGKGGVLIVLLLMIFLAAHAVTEGDEAVKAFPLRAQPYAVDAAWLIVSKSLIDRCHTAGVLVFSDALGLHETPQQYERASRHGIDLIQTDHPVRVLRTLELLER